MPATNLLICQKRVISVLQANRLNPYGGVVGTGSSQNSRYQVTQEITDSILEHDAIICQARMATPGDTYRNTWVSVSADIANGALIPAHIGAVVGFQVKTTPNTYIDGRFAGSRAEILAMRKHPALYPNATDWGFIEEGILYLNTDFGRVWRSTFTKSAACQSPEQDEMAVVAGAVSGLAKDGSVTPEIYSMGATYFQWYIQTVITGNQVPLPEVETIESALAA